MNKVRIGLIGVGGIAQGAHLPALAENPDVEIAAICCFGVRPAASGVS